MDENNSSLKPHYQLKTQTVEEITWTRVAIVVEFQIMLHVQFVCWKKRDKEHFKSKNYTHKQNFQILHLKLNSIQRILQKRVTSICFFSFLCESKQDVNHHIYTVNKQTTQLYRILNNGTNVRHLRNNWTTHTHKSIIDRSVIRSNIQMVTHFYVQNRYLHLQ